MHRQNYHMTPNPKTTSSPQQKCEYEFDYKFKNSVKKVDRPSPKLSITLIIDCMTTGYTGNETATCSNWREAFKPTSKTSKAPRIHLSRSSKATSKTFMCLLMRTHYATLQHLLQNGEGKQLYVHQHTCVHQKSFPCQHHGKDSPTQQAKTRITCCKKLSNRHARHSPTARHINKKN
uniref:Uncharacterized protein n=1 Tax=Physcomitrium patens TaxID=3218 RepID=A0A2K1L0P8_PHYPA|nr:hypothetical protein PHYPA_002386 [Physcomitrium patens]